MAPDPELVAETRACFVKAANDLRAADALGKTEPALLAEVVFHSQQAAGKAVKGFLRKTHNLEEVGEQCLKLVPADGNSRQKDHPFWTGLRRLSPGSGGRV